MGRAHASPLTHLVHLLRFRRAASLLRLCFLSRASGESYLLFANLWARLGSFRAHPLSTICHVLLHLRGGGSFISGFLILLIILDHLAWLDGVLTRFLLKHGLADVIICAQTTAFRSDCFHLKLPSLLLQKGLLFFLALPIMLFFELTLPLQL